MSLDLPGTKMCTFDQSHLLALDEGPCGPDEQPGPLELVDNHGTTGMVHHAGAHVDARRQAHLKHKQRYFYNFTQKIYKLETLGTVLLQFTVLFT
jgi:hypothetical protein